MNIQSALVRAVLEKWRAYEWTVQGFGMLRTKIGGVGRIHIWDSALRTLRVSDIHAHPWDLCSTVISGELINQRFEVFDAADRPRPAGSLGYVQSLLATGEGGGLKGDQKSVWLLPGTPEFYVRGLHYAQPANQVHRSIPIDGTVTLLERTEGPPLQETFVFWPSGTAWGSAEPRPATPYEIDNATSYALARWESA